MRAIMRGLGSVQLLTSTAEDLGPPFPFQHPPAWWPFTLRLVTAWPLKHWALLITESKGASGDQTEQASLS